MPDEDQTTTLARGTPMTTKRGSILTPARRAIAAATVSLIGLLPAGCGLAADETSSYWAGGYPAAPAQHLANGEAVSPRLGDGRIADLAASSWVARTAAVTAIPTRVLTAYAGASLRMARARPGCGIGWNTLAGIGAVESVHGSYGDASVSANGTVGPPILGVPLDGSEGVMSIPDTDDGMLDGDSEWDRAMGPMQFIPTTWQRYAQDGNGDGQTDPHQIDDAVLTAAAYLCEHGGDLTTDAGWNAAVAAYNQSRPYALDVADRAAAYTETPSATASDES